MFDINEDFVQSLSNSLCISYLKKCTFLLEAGKRSNSIYFIDKGLVRGLDFQQNTGQIFKQLVETACYNSRKGRDSLTPNACIGDYTKSQCTQRLPV